MKRGKICEFPAEQDGGCYFHGDLWHLDWHQLPIALPHDVASGKCKSLQTKEVFGP